MFNVYYASIAEYKGTSDGLDKLDINDAVEKHVSNQSVKLIKTNIGAMEEFNFNSVSPEYIMKYIKCLQTNKSVGFDGIHAKFVKLSGVHIANPLCDLFNRCVSSCHFPSDMKLAEISPIYKKNDNMCKDNYRSVNLLPVISKIFEKIVADQLLLYFDKMLSPFLSAYRKGYSCQHVIMQLTEYWRLALDEGDCVGTVAMDLSKAFDSMPHGLLIAKLRAYNISYDACLFMVSYLKNRRQRVKIQGQTSEWADINRGVSQGSVLGPLLFNIFINDLFYVPMKSHITNYADDSSLSNSHKHVSELTVTLQKDTGLAVDWFRDNNLGTNTSKFQGIVLSRGDKQPLVISVLNNTIISTDKIKMLGVTLDDKLNFNAHIDNICRSASRQINALKRLSRHLDKNSRVLIYKSFITSNFTYSPVAWIFCAKRKTKKLEKLNERALRFVFADFKSNYEDLLKQGNFLPLSLLRLKFLAIEEYKCVHNLNPPYLNQLFSIHDVEYNLRDPYKLLQPKFKTYRFGFRSFRCYGAKVWNSLPPDIKSASCLQEFRCNIYKWCLTVSPNDFDIL